MEEKKDGKTETENGESKQSFSPSFFLSSHSYPLTMLSITEISCTSSPCLCLPLLSRILILIELITCGVLYVFQYVHPKSEVCWGGEEDGGERWESRADFDCGGKLEREL